MNKVAKVINTIGSTSSMNEKLMLLKVYGNVEGLKPILKFIYNPYCKTGISKAKLAKAMKDFPTGSGAHKVDWPDALEYFSTHQTGSSYDRMIAKEFILFCGSYYGPDAAELAKAIVTQDLKIGITATSLNKVYGATFIPKTGCMLGTLYSSVGHDKTKWPCIVTEKLDGVRRILVKDNGVCRMYSRSGHEDTGLVEIIEEAKYLPNGFMYDGELLAKGTFKDSIAHRQATNSIANMKGEKTGLIFNVFDMVPVEAFYKGSCLIPAKERKIRLAATLMDDSLSILDDDWARRQTAFGINQKLEHIAAVPILGVVNSLEEASDIVEAIWARGGEGIMLSTVEGPYGVKRSKHLLKVKHTEEFVLTVVDVLEGTNKYEDSLGAIVVDYKGSRVGVGSGFTDWQRQTIWQNPEKIIGKKVEIESFGESTNMHGNISLNCPIFKRVVGDVE